MISERPSTHHSATEPNGISSSILLRDGRHLSDSWYSSNRPIFTRDRSTTVEGLRPVVTFIVIEDLPPVHLVELTERNPFPFEDSTHRPIEIIDIPPATSLPTENYLG
jgi:hypothetical protein